MKLKKITARVSLMVMACLSAFVLMSALNVPVIDTVYAAGLEDNLGSTSSVAEGDVLGEVANTPLDENDQGTADWIKGQRNLTPGQLESASRMMSPITTIIGYITGAIVVLTVAGVVMITALDLLYIAIPPVRGILYSGGAQGGAGAMGAGMMGGMSMGGMRGGMMGGAAAAQGGGKNIQWVSDEAVACAAMMGGGTQGGAGVMGAGMMGGMQQQNQSVGSVIGTYFKKRIFFLLLLALCLVVLTSSAIMDCGVNLAEWVLKLITMFNNKI